MDELLERKKLIEALDQAMGRIYPREVIDFILADRKRICEPLVELKDYLVNQNGYLSHETSTLFEDAEEAIDKTLHLAGITEEK